MKKQHRTAKESYRIRTHLIHGNHESKHWDFDHHLVRQSQLQPPKSAWSILVYGLPTLATRMVNQQKSATRVAQFLERHPRVASVHYPGLETFPQYQLARRQMTSYDGNLPPEAWSILC